MILSLQPLINLLPWKYRRALLRRLGIKFSKTAFLEGGTHFSSGNVSFGDKAYVNHGLVIEGRGEVTIGNGVSLGSGVHIITSHHDISDNPKARASWQVTYKPVTICDGAWIGSDVTILPGCTIAEGCVIGAGALVSRSAEPNGLYLGVPARRIRDLGTPTAAGTSTTRQD
jgi:maltose O-acetyltransferase